MPQVLGSSVSLFVLNSPQTKLVDFYFYFFFQQWELVCWGQSFLFVPWIDESRQHLGCRTARAGLTLPWSPWDYFPCPWTKSRGWVLRSPPRGADGPLQDQSPPVVPRSCGGEKWDLTAPLHGLLCSSGFGTASPCLSHPKRLQRLAEKGHTHCSLKITFLLIPVQWCSLLFNPYTSD